MTPADIAASMDGKPHLEHDGTTTALLPSPCIQNHAAFLSRDDDLLSCLWFGGRIEGAADISIYRSTLRNGVWGAAEQLSDDPRHSEQNPVQFRAPDGQTLLIHTAQPGGNQDACVVRMREIGRAPCELPLPKGTFVRAPIHVRADGAWLLPLFFCTPQPGRRWTGAHDRAAVAISCDAGVTWRIVDVPESIGCVHMTLVPLGGDRIAAFFRRRQADFVYRTESDNAGESWSVPEPTDVPNNNSSISVIRLADGSVAMACNPVNATMSADRRVSLYDELDGNDARPEAEGGCTPVWGVPRAPMTLCLSRDEGRTFPQRRNVEAGPGTCLSNDSIDGRNKEMSYPSLLQAQDGSLDLAYTYHRRAIKHVRLSPEWIAQ